MGNAERSPTASRPCPQPSICNVPGPGDELGPDEIAALREATPGVEHVIHLNHAGSSLPSRAVLATQIDHLRREAEIGGYEAADEATEADAAVYTSIARLIGAAPDEIARAEHATAAWNAGFWSVPMRAGQHILTAKAAYGANGVAFLRAVERHGVTVEVIPDDEYGQVDVGALARRIDDDVALVALTHVPTNGGLVNPAAAVGAIANAAGVPYLLDACQSVGQLHIDVTEIGCDLLSSTGRKYLRGPRGSGFLYASRRLIDRLETDHPDHHGAPWTSPNTYALQPDARRFEYWEYNHAGWLALGTAVDEAIDVGTVRIEATVTARAATLRDRLVAAGITVWDKGRHRCGLVTASLDGIAPDVARAALHAKGINVSICTPDSTRFDSTDRALPDLLRLSVHYLTTEAELDAAVRTLVELR